MDIFQRVVNETFSPIFWIESLINWPKSLLGLLGFEKEGAFAKLLQILFLVVEVVGAIILVVRNYTSQLLRRPRRGTNRHTKRCTRKISRYPCVSL